jgi:hypothetical protein
MNTATTNNRIKVTLTGRRPVSISHEEWPVIAVAKYSDHDNEYEFQATRRWKGQIKVRQHLDGRTLVYGTDEYDTQWRHEDNYEYKAGEMLDKDDDIPAAVLRVGHALVERGACNTLLELAHECISKLPPVQA